MEDIARSDEKNSRIVVRWHAEAAKWRDAHAKLFDWHRWFAWHPVRIGNNDCRWLETVERRFEYDNLAGGRLYYAILGDCYYRPALATQHSLRG